MLDLSKKTICIFGSTGLLGQSLCKKLSDKGINYIGLSSKDGDVRNPDSVKRIFDVFHPTVVFNCFVSYAGLLGNLEHPYSVLRDNILGNMNIIENCKRVRVHKLIQCSSQCVFGDKAETPFLEEDMWNFGVPSNTNLEYGLSKRIIHTILSAARKEFNLNSIVLIPSNLYGCEGENWHMTHTHVIPSLIQRLVKAKEDKLEFIECWGNGLATREFLYNDDAAEALILAAEKYDGEEAVNIGTGRGIEIRELVKYLAELIGFKGEIIFNNNGLDGQAYRVSNVEKAKKYFDFTAKTTLEAGIKNVVDYYLENRNNLRVVKIYE